MYKVKFNFFSNPVLFKKIYRQICEYCKIDVPSNTIKNLGVGGNIEYPILYRTTKQEINKHKVFFGLITKTDTYEYNYNEDMGSVYKVNSDCTIFVKTTRNIDEINKLFIALVGNTCYNPNKYIEYINKIHD